MQTRRIQLWDDVTKFASFWLLFSFSCLFPQAVLAGPPPNITAQPLDQNVALGGTAIFTVTATSGTALSYQWYKDGLLNLDSMLVGQTSTNLIINNVGLLDPGTFYVVVKNAAGSVESRHASLSIVLINNAPVANNDAYTTSEDVSLNVMTPGILANDTDADNITLTAVLVSNATHGNVNLNANGHFVYTPNTNYTGSDSFTYAANDGSVNGNTATVTINITPVNDAPIANNDSYTTPEDVTLVVPVVGLLSTGIAGAGVLANDTDAEGDALTALLVSNVSHGSLSLNANGSFTYTPAPNYNGPDYFTYRAADGSATGNVATVTIDVTPVSDQPRITSQRMTTGGFELQVSVEDSASVVIWASTNLRDWTPISTNSAAGGTLVYTDPAASNYSARYYRVESR
jgi:VCBS repeat-containing protein